MMTTGKLQPIRHPQMDFFAADILDANPKDDMASMEHPMFALQAGDMEKRRYEHRGNWVELTPSSKGLATMHDKDVLIYLSSQLIEAMNRGREVSRTVRLTAYDLLVTTNRPTGGVGYERLKEALHRLRNTSVETNVKTGDFLIEKGFGWIDDWTIVRYSKTGKMESVEITLSKWLWNAIKSREVLTLSKDYFRLRRPIERRVYELCRKHCGAQRKWQVSMVVLHRKSGSKASPKEFHRMIKELVASDHLPDYRIRINEPKDLITVYARSEKGAAAQILDTLNDGGMDLGDLFLKRRRKGSTKKATKALPGKPKVEEQAPRVDVEPSVSPAPKTEGEPVPLQVALQGKVDPPRPPVLPKAPQVGAESSRPPRPVIEHPDPAPAATIQHPPAAEHPPSVYPENVFPPTAKPTERPPEDPKSAEIRTRSMDLIWAALGKRGGRS